MSTNIFNPADRRKYPERWPMLRGKQLFEVVDNRSEDGTEELLSVSHITGITPRSQKNVTMFKSESLVGYKRCAVGDVAANTMWTWQGAIGVSAYAGVVSPAYNVYRQREATYNPRYLDFLLREKDLVSVYHSLSTGIRPSRLRLYPDVFLTIYFPVPPADEQDKIVRFLDWKVSGINKLINQHKSRIQVLTKLKSKLIDDVTLRGLYNVSLRQNDDIRWDIAYPMHWKLLRLRELFAFRKGLSITKANLEDSGIPVISYGQVHSKKNSGVGINDELIRFVNASYLETDANALVEHGDFIFADTSEDVVGCGNCVYVDRDETIFAGYHTVIAHPKSVESSRYLSYLFQAPTWRYQIHKKVSAVKVYSITQKILKDVFVLLPPLDEQKRIVEYLDERCSPIDALIAKIECEIQQLRNLKSALISDVVTGEIDVREVEIPEYEFVADIGEDNADDSDEEIEGEEG